MHYTKSHLDQEAFGRARFQTFVGTAGIQGVPEKSFIDVGVTGSQRKNLYSNTQGSISKICAPLDKGKAGFRGPFVEIADCKKS
jgi:hypothetical protein